MNKLLFPIHLKLQILQKITSYYTQKLELVNKIYKILYYPAKNKTKQNKTKQRFRL
ncbi:hypothetical protein HanRHA438_Chr05g0227671 [Helianthus annuus]|nr:hypothetical protein HanRHA438_Chr05g0227671 [Helianthus annuus]